MTSKLPKTFGQSKGNGSRRGMAGDSKRVDTNISLAGECGGDVRRGVVENDDWRERGKGDSHRTIIDGWMG